MSTTPTPESTGTALEKPADRTPAVITTPEEYRGALLRWQAQHYNVLTPFVNISGLAACHGIFASVVQVNLDKSSGQTYDGLPFLKKDKEGKGDDEVALAKNGLRMIAEGLGISTRLEYISVGTIRHYWNVKAIATYRGLDGATVTREAGMEWDLRDGSDRLKGWTTNQISEARKHGLRACETRAINAVIRECGCGVKQAYKRSELARPFVAVRVAFQPDMNDPDQKRMLLEHSLAGTNAMYPASRTFDHPVLDEPFEEDRPAPRQVGSSSTQPVVSPASTAAAQDPDPAPSPNAVKIVKLESTPGNTNGRAWIKHVVIDSRGVEYSTFSKSIAEQAAKFRDSKAWVDILDEQNGEYRNVVEIGPAQPSLLPNPENL